MEDKQLKRKRRHRRVRSKIVGTNKVPRLCVFRSNKHIYAQLIDDEKGKTLVSASDLDTGSAKRLPRGEAGLPRGKAGKTQSAKPKQELKGKAAIAYRVGKILAQKALEKKFEKVIFDRGGYKYHGRIKALAESARENGLKF